jgi:asparagine synthase (glutamine-hydrolysing)
MCGIAGWLAAEETAPPEETIHRMLDAIAHRGPDDHGIYFQASGEGHQQVMLGHRRLAIIDPDGARQPMVDGPAGVSLVFNGEIYNFRELRRQLEREGHAFTRDSDTEVLLRAYQHWGTDVVHHLRGMFAFVISDMRRGLVLMARDRFGEKPLFLCQQGRNLYFASEIKALLQLPKPRPPVDESAVWDDLAFRYVPGPKTLLQGVRKLAPGTCAIWKDGKVTERRYWSAPDKEARPSPQPSPKGEGAADPLRREREKNQCAPSSSSARRTSAVPPLPPP